MKIAKRLMLLGTISFSSLALTSCSINEVKDFINNIIKDDVSDKSYSPNINYDGNTYNDFQIHFLELGNDYTGDSIYIKAGENDILIDAGSRENSFDTISSYVNNYCTDKKLEYVIATHADRDHISSMPKIFDNYKVDSLIDFTYTNKTTATYQNYLLAREKASTHYTAKDCFYELNGAKRKYTLGKDENGTEMNFEILYNYYYTELSKNENNNSVVTMFNYGDYHFLLTGDLEKEGEEKLVQYYDGSTEEKTLPEVDLMKAGHHGSYTATNESILDLVKPKMSVVTCVAGSTEHAINRKNTFPSQDFIDRISKYTDEVYVTSMYSEETDKTLSLNGNIVVSSNGEKLGLSASETTDKLKDTKWFSHGVWVDSQDRITVAGTNGAKKVPCRTLPDAWKTK